MLKLILTSSAAGIVSSCKGKINAVDLSLDTTVLGSSLCVCPLFLPTDAAMKGPFQALSTVLQKKLFFHIG